MGILNFLKDTFSLGGQKPSTEGDQAVLVFLDGVNLSAEVYESCDLVTLEDKLLPVLEASGAGELDGSESGPTKTCLFFYGPNADQLFSAIKSTLERYPLCSGARVILRYGGPGSREHELRLQVV